MTESKKVVGTYVLQDELSMWSTSTTYLATSHVTADAPRTAPYRAAAYANQVVVLDLPHAHLDDGTRMAFRINASTMLPVRHPNVVTTLDVRTGDPDVFAVYEYVQGASVLRLVRDSKTTPPRDVTVRILCDALEGLHCAHEFPVHVSYTKVLGETPIDGHVVHRALNLGCLRVGVDGVTRVEHFEPVRPWRGHDLRPLLGSLFYASREVIFNDAVVTRTADVHSVGMMLFELLSNSRPYDSELSIIHARRSGEVPLPSNVDPRLASFDTIVRTACSPDPASRYPTALAMARALRQVETPASAEAVGQWVMEKRGRNSMHSRSALPRLKGHQPTRFACLDRLVSPQV